MLFLFMMMLMNFNGQTERQKSLLFKVLAWTASALLGLSLILFIFNSSFLPPSQKALEGKVESLGLILFTEYAIPFEFTTVLFLSAVIGVVSIGKKSKGDAQS